jgi:serine/threonine protein kinase
MERIARSPAATLEPFTKRKLTDFAAALKAQSTWSELLGRGHYDREAKVTYVRRNVFAKDTLPPSSFAHTRDALYVASKEKVGEGGFKRFVYAIDLRSLMPCVLGSIKLTSNSACCMTQESIRKLAAEELNAHRTLLGKSGFPNLLHTFIVPAKDGTYEKLYMVFERAIHGSFDKVMFSPVFARMRSNIEDFMSVYKGILKAARQLEDANMLHRDIKPGNIFITESEKGKLIAKLGDFTLTLSIDKMCLRLRSGEVIFGQNDPYACPSVRAISQKSSLKESEIITVSDVRTDIWGIGHFLYILLHGAPLNTLSTNQEEIDSFLEQINTPSCFDEKHELLAILQNQLRRMLKVKPGDRPFASELKSELDLLQ